MQNLKGSEAQTITAQEFLQKVMKPLRKLAERILAEHAHLLKSTEPIYSLDKYSVHMRAIESSGWLHDSGDTSGNVFPLPHHAPDIHKVIQHVHGGLTRSMNKFVTELRRGGGSPRVYRLHLKHLFHDKVVTADSVRKDVDSLIETLQIIAKPVSKGGTNGDWAPKGYN